MKNIIRTIYILSAVIMTAFALNGCGTVTRGTGESAAVGLEQVTLKMYIPGNRPIDMDEVISQAEERMKDTVNVKLDMIFVPWSDLASKTQVALITGEDIDLVYDAPWMLMNEMISGGYYEPLDDLIQQYGKNIITTRTQALLDANRFEGAIYGIPSAGGDHAVLRSYAYRKDLAEKYEIPQITNYEQLIEFLYIIKDSEPDLIPLSAGTVIPQTVAGMRLESETNLRPTPALPADYILYFDGNDGKVKNLFDDITDEILSYFTETRKLYEDKIIDQDILASAVPGNSLLQEGKRAVATHNSTVLFYDVAEELKNIYPDAELDTYNANKFEKGKYITTFQRWDFMCVPKISKNKERVIMFIDWVNAEQANFDLVMYGVEGKNWEPVGDRQINRLNADFPPFGYAWGNPMFIRSDSRYTPADIEKSKFLSDANNYVPDILIGFTFNAEPVTDEITLYNNLQSKYMIPISNGVIDPEENWEAFKNEGYDAVKIIQDELQKQIDTFLVSNS